MLEPSQYNAQIRGPGRKGSVCALLVCLLMLLWHPADLGAANSKNRLEYELKAAMLYKVAMFVEWPAKAMPAPGEPLVIGVLGEDPFGRILDEMIAGEQVYGHPIETRRFARLSDLHVCHLLFISDSFAGRLPDIAQAVEAVGVLTIGESEGFARQGGMIGLIREGRNVRLEVAIDVAQKAGFRVSSKLLRVAKVIKGLPR